MPDNVKPDASCSLCHGTREVRDGVGIKAYPETAPCPKCSDGTWALIALRAKMDATATAYSHEAVNSMLENAVAETADEMAFLRERVSTLTRERDDALVEIQVLNKAIAIGSMSAEDRELF